MTALEVAGKHRVLVVEDEALIAMIIEDALTDLGCEMVDPASTVEAAIRLARDEPLDAAFLDVTIRGGDVFPVAEILLQRGVPFVFSSGYGDWALPDAFRGHHRLTKPFTAVELEEMVRTLCRHPGRSPLATTLIGQPGF